MTTKMYDAKLQENEDRATLDCGCVLTMATLTYCNMHRHAPLLLDAVNAVYCASSGLKYLHRKDAPLWMQKIVKARAKAI